MNDHEKAIAAIRSQGGTDADVEAYLHSVGAQVVDDPNAALHAQYKSGALAKNQADKNAADQVGKGDFFSALALEPLATVASGVPGASLLASKAGSLLSGDTMANTQNEINARTSDVPYASAAAKALGTTALMPVLPASAMGAGAILGGADQLLNNDPGSSAMGRAGRGLLGVAGGALAGKYLDRAITAGRAAVSPAADVLRNRLLANRTAEARSLFGQAMAEGQGKAMPKPVLDFLNSPDIAPIVSDLQGTRVHANTPADSPEMLDAVYKVLSDRGLAAKGKLAALVPRNANLGRIAAKDIGMAKDEALNAMSRGPGAPMPTYEQAVNNFRNNSRGIDSFDTGFNALRSEMSGSLPSAKNLSRPDKASASLEDWLSGLNANTADAEMASQGIISGVRKAKNAKAADAAAKLLRSTDRARGLIAPNASQKAVLGGLLAYLSP